MRLTKATMRKYPVLSGLAEAIAAAIAAKKKDETRAILRSRASPVPSGSSDFTLRRTLCDQTVPIASIAPSPVDMEAATMATNNQPPINADIGKYPSSPVS